MKNALKALCVLFLVAVLGFGYFNAYDGGVSYEFVPEGEIEKNCSGNYAITATNVKKNDTEESKEVGFESKDVAISQTYKCNVKLQQAQWRLIEKETGVMFTSKYTKKIDPEKDKIKGDVAPNEYYWVEFTPTMNKIKGNIVEKHGGKEVKKTYVEIVYPDAEESNKKTTVFKTSKDKPAEKLS